MKCDVKLVAYLASPTTAPELLKLHAMLSILRKSRLKDKELRLLLLGLDNAGKTTIVKQLLHEDPTSISPTLGFIITTLDFDGYKLNICILPRPALSP